MQLFFVITLDPAKQRTGEIHKRNSLCDKKSHPWTA